MIKANELRHKNYFMHNGLIVQISGFRTYSTDTPLVRFEMMGGEYDIKSLVPAPLTEEILLKCGAVKSGVVFKLSPINIWWSSYAGCFCFRYMNVGEDIDNLIRLEHLHKLQNLYFALTGEELTVKL